MDGAVLDTLAVLRFCFVLRAASRAACRYLKPRSLSRTYSRISRGVGG